MLHDFLGSARDIELVDPPPDFRRRIGLSAAPNAVLLTSKSGSDAECWDELLVYPSSSIIAVDLQSQTSSIFQFPRHKEELGEASTDQFLEAIRQIVHRKNQPP